MKYIKQYESFINSDGYLEMSGGKEEKEINQELADEYIKKVGWADTTIGYVNINDVDVLKELGVKYKVKPLKYIRLHNPLSDYFKKNKIDNIEFLTVSDSGLIENSSIIQVFLNSKTREECVEIKENIKSVINNFNSVFGSEYYISKTKGDKDDDSIGKSILAKLEGSEDKTELKYKKLTFLLDRHKDEDDYLVVVDYDFRKPEML